jgi:anti-sigma regulatory factor (Ser/Thr protein kinase)
MEGLYHVLVVEPGSAGESKLAPHFADGPFHVQVLDDLAEVLPRLSEETCHLVVAMVTDDAAASLDLLSDIRTRHARLPVILVAPRAGVDTVVQALRRGVTNFFPWPGDPDELRRAVRKCLRPWAISAGERSVLPRMRKTIEMDLVSSTTVIDPVFAHVYDDGRSLGFPEAVLRLNVYLALNEALANAVRHGNREDPRKAIHVVVDLTASQVDIRVTDEGEGFDPGELPDPTDAENLFKASGRGVFLMRCYMDEVEYLDGGRTVRLIKHASSE